MSISKFTAKVLTLTGVLGLGMALPAIADNHSPAETEMDAAEVEIEAVETEVDAVEAEVDETISQTEEELMPAATIGEIVGAVPEFSTLEAAIEAAELGEALMGEGPFTVIAPVNDAFDTLPDGVLEALLLPENQDLLTDVLTYHVIPGEVMYDDLETGTVETLGGEELFVTVDNDMALVDEVPIVGFDIPATNGLIHIIEDGVLVPEDVVAELESRLAAIADETVGEEDVMVEEEPMVEEPEVVVEEPVVEETTAPAEPVRGLW